MAAAARLAARIFGAGSPDVKTGSEEGGGAGVTTTVVDRTFADRLRAFGQSQLDWILGLNPFDSCMLHAKGRNNIPYMFFDSYEYTNAPGGICNGITGGYTDEEDIDFGLRFAVTGKDDDWRWGEQWLPHSAWYLYAVAIGD
jgi:hypothetical protein